MMRGIGELLGETPLLAVGLGLFLALLAARELGVWINRLLTRRAPERNGEETDDGFVLSGVLGLLALLVAFTFGMALNRYETRREMVVAEANAIGTAHMRFQMLDEPDRARMSALLTAYAETRLAYGRARDGDKPALAQRSAAQRSAIEAAAVEAIRPVRATPLGSSLMSAANSVLDVGVEREAALAARVPGRVLLVLLLYAVVSAAAMGYATAGAGSRPRAAMVVLFLLLTLAISTILDLDRPRGGAIQVDQGPMADLVQGLRQAPSIPVAKAGPP